MQKDRTFFGRSLARSHALQLLFQAELRDMSVEDVLVQGACLEKGPLDDFARILALGVEQKLDELDSIISARSAAWPVERMPLVDRNLLRIALYEMLYVAEVETAVAIDESVELAKAYGTLETPRFVNGILGRVADQIDAGTNPIELAQSELASRKPSGVAGFGWESEYIRPDDADVDTDSDSASDVDELTGSEQS